MNKFSPLVQSVFDGLLNAYNNHIKLGDSGRIKDKPNRFSEMALRADVEAEECILSSLKKFAESSNLKLVYKGEESGEGQIGRGEKIIFAVFDGLDGSSNYLKKGEYGYGTMVAVSEKDNPKYNDFTICGLAMMEEGKIVISIKTEGVYVYDVITKKTDRLKQFTKENGFDDSKVLANKYFPEELNSYGDKPWTMIGSTAWSIFSICTNDRFDGLIEVTRKGNLEQPVLYLMITTLGGIMVDKYGNSIGNNYFNEWGQKEKLIVVTAKNELIAKAILKSIKI